MIQILRSKATMTALLLLLMAPLIKTAKANEIHMLLPATAGVLWEGLAVNGSYTETAASMNSSRPWVACIITSYTFCASASNLTTVNGMKALKLKSTTGKEITGLGLVPVLKVTATYYPKGSTTPETMTGTIGPKTQAVTSSGETIPEDPSHPWKLFLRNSDDSDFFEKGTPINVQASGYWMLVADGSQERTVVDLTKKELSINQFYFGGAGIDLFLDTKLHVRVTSMECSIDTPRVINFGAVEKTTRPYAEIARRTEEFTAICAQDAAYPIGADIMVQFRPISGLFDHPGRLAFQAAGSTDSSGFITGSIAKKTGYSACHNPDGIQFDGTPITIGRVYNSSLGVTVIPNTVTWRLCSSDKPLPDGRIQAAAEMLVTFF